MQDPSHRVAQPLQNHVHLISGHRFPLSAVLTIEQAFRYLLDATQIVKQVAPVSWTYVQAPQDGTIWLEWVSPNRTDNRFSSDGYVWMDPEQTYRQDVGGYTIEMMVHTLGYRPNYDSMASHARTRYHFIAKSPSIAAAPPDPMLWIVHYHPADPSRVLPTAQIPPTPQMQQILSERRWLESQGRLEKKDFMLHDQEHWPIINVPNGAHIQRQMQQTGFYGVQPPPNPTPRAAPYPQVAGYTQQPPQKRQRQQGPTIANEQVVDTSVEDEENTTLGDFFDHLTPRDISLARYTQHHRWMEEVFSSPYSSYAIAPADLGLGLMGELKGLTEGIIDGPSLDFLQPPANTLAQEAKPFTNLKQEQLDEFNRRVEVHLRESRAEIERMKAEHAIKMQEWKRTKTLIQAEKKLRTATWEGHEHAVPAFRLEDAYNNSHDQERVKSDSIERIISNTEDLLGVKIVAHEEATMLARGGLEEEQPEPAPEVERRVPETSAASVSADGKTSPARERPQLSGISGAANGTANTSTMQPTQMQTSPSAKPTAEQIVPPPEDDVVLDDMDLDISQGEIDFGDAAGDFTTANDTTSLLKTVPGQEPRDSAAASTESIPPSLPQAARTQEAVTESKPATATAPPPMASMPGDGDSGLLHNTEFGNLASMGEGEDGDGLIDFDGGLVMDDSAFGDAMHGMEDLAGEMTPQG